MPNTVKECSYGGRNEIRAAVFVSEYAQEEYATWVEATAQALEAMVQGKMWGTFAAAPLKPEPVAIHYFELTPDQNVYGWGYAMALCELFKRHDMPLTGEELTDIRCSLESGTVEPVFMGT